MTDPIIGTRPVPAPLPPQLPSEIPAQGLETKLLCPNCQMETSVGISDRDQVDFRCNFCKRPVSTRIFPRLTIPPTLSSSVDLAGGGDATCQFYHELKAEVVCDECGCFMSKKASVTWGERMLCLPCLHTLRETRGDLNYRASLKIWDNRALALLAFLPLTLFTAPITLFLLIRYRKEPPGWIPRSAFRWWLALILTIVILSGWTALIVVWIAMMAREMS